jgi:hypothetical protein
VTNVEQRFAYLEASRSALFAGFIFMTDAVHCQTSPEKIAIAGDATLPAQPLFDLRRVLEDSCECDLRKLALFTAPDRRYQYQYGLYINVAAGAFECTWFDRGPVRVGSLESSMN